MDTQSPIHVTTKSKNDGINFGPDDIMMQEIIASNDEAIWAKTSQVQKGSCPSDDLFSSPSLDEHN